MWQAILKRIHPVAIVVMGAFALIFVVGIFALQDAVNNGETRSSGFQGWIDALYADPNAAGTIYVLSRNTSSQVYKSTDYGQTWSPNAFFEFPNTDSYTTPSLQFRSETLIYQTETETHSLWTLPRPIFRMFFWRQKYVTNGSVLNRYSPADVSVTYAVAGGTGLLIGHTPDKPNPSGRVWQYTNFNPDERFRPLTDWRLTNPFPILVVVICALCMPPLPFIHHWTLKQAYRYAFQPGETKELNRYAAGVTTLVTVLAAAAVIFWVTQTRFDYFEVVLVVALLTALIGAIGGVIIAKRRNFTHRFTWRIALGSALVSLCVPIGVIGIYVTWWAVITLLIGFWVYRRMLVRSLERQEAIMTHWQLDRLTLETLGIFLIMLIPLTALPLGILARVATIWVLPLALFIPLISITVLYLYIRWRGNASFLRKKNALPESGDAIPEDSPLFQGFAWWRTVFGATAFWVGLALTATTAVFMGQACVYSILGLIKV
jgi:hypothetical protein